MMKSSTLGLLLAGLVLAGCGSFKKKPEPVAASANPQVLLLGEVHDNPQGHKLRYEELRKRVAAGWRPAIAMEQFDREQQALLDEAQKGCLDANCLIRVMKGPRWDWQLYHPIIELALNNKLPLIAANLSRGDASKVVRDGVASSFDAQSVAAYRLNEALPADIVQGQEAEIRTGHCNMLPDSMVPGMVNAQVARDIWMAKLVRAQSPRDVVLIAGNGHVRRDIGVPRWLDAIQPKLTWTSIAYAEGKAGDGQFDQVRKVEAVPRPDPCAKFKGK
ncbi:ChaN family lipoprotein [Massilia sp. MB5]|uniref:ChaN family lipoprotein n=1 Tax=Massilia sp. MB5 TaxID=2919578 RepID=UPI001F0F8F15|nr:ChaN family lipoprotein [Massilia sp. MB5]UMR31102.1 ChaN family lipoprotein [Massilia sp. MB5]